MVRDWCFSQVSRWKVPRYIAFVDTMPTTASGKIVKHELRPQMAARFGITKETVTEQADEL
jgi:fatty-acyl-CoA synthase